MKLSQIPVKTPEMLHRLSRCIQTEVFMPFEDDKSPEKGYRLQIGKNVCYVRKEPLMGGSTERTLFVYPKYAKKLRYQLTGGKRAFGGQKLDAI